LLAINGNSTGTKVGFVHKMEHKVSSGGAGYDRRIIGKWKKAYFYRIMAYSRGADLADSPTCSDYSGTKKEKTLFHRVGGKTRAPTSSCTKRTPQFSKGSYRIRKKGEGKKFSWYQSPERRKRGGNTQIIELAVKGKKVASTRLFHISVATTSERDRDKKKKRRRKREKRITENLVVETEI